MFAALKSLSTPLRAASPALRWSKVPEFRTFAAFARPMARPTASPARGLPQNAGLLTPGYASAPPMSLTDVFMQQKRFKARGNTYQPSMLKRKRRAGFLARLRTKGGRKILTRRKAKGRWFLTY